MPVARSVIVALILACSAACSSEQPPSTPQTPVAPSVNRPPALEVGAVTPALGIEGVTTFRVPVDVHDPDGDPVSLTLSGCPSGTTPQVVAAQNGRLELTFKADRLCGHSVKITATDAKSPPAEQTAPFQHTSLNGPLRLVIGQGFYTQPGYTVTLRQTETVITGTIREHKSFAHEGTTDPADPGTIDGEGRFRLHFTIDGDDIVVAGQVQSADSNLLGDVLVASGQVVGGVYAGRPCQLWAEAQY